MVFDYMDYYPATYNEVFEIAKCYAELEQQERTIIAYLFDIPMFEGGYSDLAKAVNLCVDNMRKTLAKLQHMGIVYVQHNRYDDNGENGHGGMARCFLVAGWMRQLCKLDESKIFNNVSRI